MCMYNCDISRLFGKSSLPPPKKFSIFRYSLAYRAPPDSLSVALRPIFPNHLSKNHATVRHRVCSLPRPPRRYCKSIPNCTTQTDTANKPRPTITRATRLFKGYYCRPISCFQQWLWAVRGVHDCQTSAWRADPLWKAVPSRANSVSDVPPMSTRKIDESSHSVTPFRSQFFKFHNSSSKHPLINRTTSFIQFHTKIYFLHHLTYQYWSKAFQLWKTIQPTSGLRLPIVTSTKTNMQPLFEANPSQVIN